ncbi:MAG: ABC transporter permease, partial [Acidobacteriota bacterium]|nr:ABC transporter permease [Acidobacteriota bacterium]
MGSRKRLQILILALLVFHAVILLADFSAPYAFDAQNRMLAFAPPSHIHLFDAQHHYHLRPFIYPLTLRPGSYNDYQEDRAIAFPIRFFVIGSPYKLFGIVPSQRHLFGVDGWARLVLLGTDAF